MIVHPAFENNEISFKKLPLRFYFSFLIRYKETEGNINRHYKQIINH